MLGNRKYPIFQSEAQRSCNRVCLKHGETLETSNNHGKTRTGFHFTGDGDKMPTAKHDRVSRNMSVFNCSAILEPISHLEKHMAVPLIQSPLSSASTALCYSTFHTVPNGFSNVGTQFLSRLDRYSLLCVDMEIKNSDFPVM